uniref:F-box domain-containing protein n=1 Tax=Caenorhabditis tropicalis TaxID=1561998 RepID=A0A1I7TH68_9PELO
MATNIFPLLHLPILALNNVLALFTQEELIETSLTSRRARHFIRGFSRFPPYPKPTIRLYITAEPYIHLCNKPSLTYKFTRDALKDGQKKVYGNINTTIYKYTENLLEGILNWLKYVTEVLSCTIDLVDMTMDEIPGETRKLADWLKNQQESYDCVEIYCDTEADDDLKYAIETIKAKKELLLGVETGPGFQVELPENLRNLEIASSFIGLEQLLRIKCKKIALSEPPLTNQEINMFIRSWMAQESHLNLCNMRIKIAEPHSWPVILGYNEFLNFDLQQNEFTMTFRIVRIDGQMATIVIEGNVPDIMFKFHLYPYLDEYYD